jgi:hypothetical protein
VDTIAKLEQLYYEFDEKSSAKMLKTVKNGGKCLSLGQAYKPLFPTQGLRGVAHVFGLANQLTDLLHFLDG